MLNHSDIMSTVDMIDHQHLDIRTITMGISLLDCADPNPEACARKIHDKICRQAEHLVTTGCQIERELGIPIVNKRISVTPIALVASACETEDFVPFAKAMDSAAKTCGVDFIGGFSALVQKGMASGDRRLIAAIPQALAETELVCSSVNVATTKAGINMDAVRLMGQAIKKTAELTKERDGLGCAKLVVFCNAVEDNPFMAGAFHGVGEADAVVSVGVSGPGVVYHALQSVKGRPFTLCSAWYTTPGPDTPTLTTASASPTPWNAPAINGLSSTALQNTTSFAQPRPSRSFVSSAVFLIACPMRRTASMLMPAFVVATLTLEQTSSVSASACGMAAISRRSPEAMPFCTRAEKPPMKSTPQVFAALSIALANGTKSSVSHALATSAMGVTEMRLLTMGMPSSRSIWQPVVTRCSACRQILS